MKKSPLFVLSILSICLMIACKSSHVTPTYIDNTTIQNTIDEIAKSTKLDQDLIVRGVRGTAGLWTKEDGSKEEFTAFCLKNFCANQEEKELLRLFQRYRSRRSGLLDVILPESGLKSGLW